MPFSVSTRSAVDGAGATIPGGVVFIDESGAGTGPWIIAKTTIDPAGVNTQFVLSNNAAKCDISSINGTATPVGHGTAAGALRVELPTDGTGLVNAAQSGTWTVQQGGAPWSVSQSGNWTTRIVGNAGGVIDFAGQNAAQPANSILVGGEFNTTPTTIVSGNASPLQLDSAGNLLVNIKTPTTFPVSGTITANQGSPPWSVSQSGTWTVQQGTPPWTVNPGTAANWGVGATAAAIPANADYVAGNAMTTLPTAATAGNLTGVSVDKFGRPVVIASSTRDNMAGSGVTTITTTTETTIIAAGAAGVFNDIHMVLVSNTSASDVRVDIRDSTAGTIQFTFWAKANTNTVGFSSAIPWPQTTAANNWTAQLSAAVTDVRISALFVKNK